MGFEIFENIIVKKIIDVRLFISRFCGNQISESDLNFLDGRCSSSIVIPKMSDLFSGF